MAQSVPDRLALHDLRDARPSRARRMLEELVHVSGVLRASFVHDIAPRYSRQTFVLIDEEPINDNAAHTPAALCARLSEY